MGERAKEQERVGCDEDVVGRLIEAASRLWYAGAEEEADAVRSLAGWLHGRQGPDDTDVLDRFTAGASPEHVAALERALQRLRGGGHREEAATLAPFVPFLGQLRRVDEACRGMLRAHSELRALLEQDAR